MLLVIIALHVEIFSHGAICRWAFGKKTGVVPVGVVADHLEINGEDGEWLFAR